MRAFREYWTFSAIRGALTILASIAIFALPQAASSILSLPVLITLAADCFATYSIFDGAVAILLAKLLPASASRGRILYAQAAVAAITAVLLYSITIGALEARWVLWIASAQASFAAFAEYMIARDTHRQYGCFSCYGTSIVLAVSAFCLPFTHRLDVSGVSLALATYVGLYGASEMLTGGRMLFLEYRLDHPAPVDACEWRMSMLEPQLPALQFAGATPAPCDGCEACVAQAVCDDYSLDGHVAKIMLGREPSLVRAVRVNAVVHAGASAL